MIGFGNTDYSGGGGGSFAGLPSLDFEVTVDDTQFFTIPNGYTAAGVFYNKVIQTQNEYKVIGQQLEIYTETTIGDLLTIILTQK